MVKRKKSKKNKWKHLTKFGNKFAKNTKSFSKKHKNMWDNVMKMNDKLMGR